MDLRNVVLVVAVIAGGLAPSFQPGAYAQSTRRIRVSLYGGPELSGFQKGAEAAMRDAGYADTERGADPCFVPGFCPDIAHPYSNESGTQSFMLSVSFRGPVLVFDVLAGDGTGGDTRGYREGVGEDVAYFSGTQILAGTAGVRRGRVRAGAGPALMRVTSASEPPGYQTSASARRQTHTRPGLVGDVALDAYRGQSFVIEMRAQVRAFAATEVVTRQGQRLDVPYRSVFIGLGLGVEK